MKYLKKFIKNLDIIISSTVVLFIFIDVILQVISRIIPGISLSWTVELGQILLGALIWFALSIGIKENANVSFDMLISKVPEKIQKNLVLLNLFLFIIYLSSLTFFTTILLKFYLKLGSKATMLPFSMFWVRMPMVIGSLWSIVNLITMGYKTLKGDKSMFPVTEIETDVKLILDQNEKKSL